MPRCYRSRRTTWVLGGLPLLSLCAARSWWMPTIPLVTAQFAPIPGATSLMTVSAHAFKHGPTSCKPVLHLCATCAACNSLRAATGLPHNIKVTIKGSDCFLAIACPRHPASALHPCCDGGRLCQVLPLYKCGPLAASASERRHLSGRHIKEGNGGRQRRCADQQGARALGRAACRCRHRRRLQQQSDVQPPLCQHNRR